MAAQHTRFFCSLRHERSGIPQQAEQIEMPKIIQTNTTHIIIAICLGKDITPPGTLPLKHKCAHKECWLDITRTTKKEDDKLVNNLYKQYDHWWKEQREKQILELLDLPIDPTDKQLKEQCENARESAKNHRVFFHYNGRGVIQPYPQYLYVFDERHTNYTPITLKDLSSRLQTPSVYIFDCSNAGDMISMDSPLCIDGNVVLAACSSRETLPQNGDVPFDIFTSCLTTPVVMAALRFIRRTRNFSMQHTEALLEQLRNEQDCKSSIAYNLNWILTTITDTIAYNSFPKQIFLGLFRDDNLLANTMRHFMLAQRVLRLWGCNPVSFPPLPPTHSHPLWNTFDLALDVALKKMSRQNQFHPQMQMQMQMQLFPYSLPDLQYKQIRFPMSPKGIQPKLNLLFAPSPSLSNQLFVSLVFTHNEIPPISLSDKFNQIEIQQQDKNNYQLFINQHNDELKQQQQQEMSIIDYKSGLAQSTTSTQHFIDQEDGEDELQFFYEHFNSFEEWLRLGPLEGSPPVYLPIVLHGLQNRQLRLRSVQLLEQFISLGERALRQAMNAGALLICLRLFSTKGDIHYHIPSIWARILAQYPFLADQIVAYDLFFLSSTLNEEASPAFRASSAFVLSRILSVMKHIRRGYIMKDTFFDLIHSPDRYLRACALLCIAQQASKSSVECNAAVHLPNFSLIFQALKDPCVEVRAAAVNCLSLFGNIYNGDPSTSKDLHTLPQVEMLIPEKLLDCISDGSVLVRREVLAALQIYTISHYQVALNFYGLDMLLAQLDANTSPFQVFLPFQDKQNKNKNQSKKIIKIKKNVVDNKNQDESEEEIEQNPQIEDYRSQLSFHRKLILGNGENIEFQTLQDSNNQFLNQQSYLQISQQQQSRIKTNQSQSYINDLNGNQSFAFVSNSQNRQQPLQYSPLRQQNNVVIDPSVSIQILQPSSSSSSSTSSSSSSSSQSSSQSNSDSMRSKLKFKIKYFPKAQNVGEAFIAAWREQAIFCTDHFQEFNKSAKEFSINFREMLQSLIKQRTSNQYGQQVMNDRYDANDQIQRPPMPTHLCSLIFNWCSEHWKRPCVGGIAIKEKKEIKLKGWRYKRQPLFPRSYYEYGGTNREDILNRLINQRQKEIKNGMNNMNVRKYNSITDKTQRKDLKEGEMQKNEGNEEQFVDYCFGEVQQMDNFNQNRNNKEKQNKINDYEQEDDIDSDSDSYKQNSDIERGKYKLKKSQKKEEDFVFIEDEEDEEDDQNSLIDSKPIDLQRDVFEAMNYSVSEIEQQQQQQQQSQLYYRTVLQIPQISQQSSSQQQQVIQQQSQNVPTIPITDYNAMKNGNYSTNKQQFDSIPKKKYKQQKQSKTIDQKKLLVQLQLKIQPQFQPTLYKSFISNSHPGINIASSQLSSSSSASTASLFSQSQAQLQSSQSGIGIGMNPNISINERDKRDRMNVSSMSTSNLGFVYNPNSNTGYEFNLVHIAQIQFTNGVTHTTFHPKERVVAIGSSKRNIVGIYEVSFQIPKQSSSSPQDDIDNQRERNKDRVNEKEKEKDKEKEREKNNTQLNKVNNVRIFQIPPPAPPQLHIEKVDEHIKKYLTMKKLEPLTHPQEYTPMSFPRLATLDFLNEGSDTRMIISTQDSAVKVLSFPNDNNACKLITSFFAFPLSLFASDELQSNINQQLSHQSSVSSMNNVATEKSCSQQSQLFNPTFLLSWSQRTGLLAAAGEPLQYRIWDVEQEQCILDQETGFDTPSSSLALDQLGWTLAIGSHYGVVRLFDRREYDVEPVMSLCLDDNPLRPSNQDFALSDDVVNLAFTATRQHELIAAARNTQIALFDLRMPKQRQRRKELITHNNTNMNQSLRINNNGCFFPYSLLTLSGGIIPLKNGQSLAQGFAQQFTSSTLSQVDKSLSYDAMINPDLYYNEESPSDQSTIPQWLWNSRGKGNAYLVNRRLGSHYMSTTNCFAKVDNLSNILHDTQDQSSDGIDQGDIRSSSQQIASTGQHDQDIEHTAAFAMHPLFPYALLATTERKNNYAFGLQNGELIQYERACAQLGTSQVIGSAQKLQLGMDGDPPVQTMAWHPNEGALVVSYGTKHANVFIKE